MLIPNDTDEWRILLAWCNYKGQAASALCGQLWFWIALVRNQGHNRSLIPTGSAHTKMYSLMVLQGTGLVQDKNIHCRKCYMSSSWPFLMHHWWKTCKHSSTLQDVLRWVGIINTKVSLNARRLHPGSTSLCKVYSLYSAHTLSRGGIGWMLTVWAVRRHRFRFGAEKSALRMCWIVEEVLVNRCTLTERIGPPIWTEMLTLVTLIQACFDLRPRWGSLLILSNMG